MASVSGTKRLNSDDNDVHTPKIQRVEHHSSHGNGNGLPAAHHAGSSPHQRLPTANNDFSGSVKRKLADSKRTGQACDRCKVSAPSFPPSPSPPLLYLGAVCSAVQCTVQCACAGCCMLPIARHREGFCTYTDRARLCCTRRTPRLLLRPAATVVQGREDCAQDRIDTRRVRRQTGGGLYEVTATWKSRWSRV
jgi:hypothetical protein